MPKQTPAESQVWEEGAQSLSSGSRPLDKLQPLQFTPCPRGMLKRGKGGQGEGDAKPCSSWVLYAYSSHWAGNKGRDSPSGCGKAGITHQTLRGTMSYFLLKIGPWGRIAGSQYIWEKTEKRPTSNQPLLGPPQGNSSQLRVPQSKPHPELWEKVLRANWQAQKPQRPGNPIEKVFLPGKIP